jgi:hypothetical protein
MATGSKRKTRPAREGVTAAGLVEAFEQDVELSIEQVRDAAQEAVTAVEKKLGMRKPRARKTAPKPKTTKTSKPAKRRLR